MTLEAISAGVMRGGEMDSAADAHIAQAIRLMRLVIIELRLAAPGSTASAELSFVVNEGTGGGGQSRDAQ